MSSILIVDDEPNIRRMVGALLRTEGYDVREAATGAQALTSILDDEPDVALLDLMIPGDLDGLATLSKIRERWSDLPIVMMSGRASLADAVRATKLGAFNFLEKPLSPETVLLALSSALELRQTRRTARALREELGLTGQMVGSSPLMTRVREVIERVAPSDARVLISGESGTGKELVAAAIHDRSPRRDRPFIRVNCAAIPRDLVESEMFGHEKGSFTGATTTRTGRFELAHTGTLFLDEVGDLTIEAQAKLLRAIEAKEIQRVGGNRTIRIDVRILAATNKDLTRAVADGTFREDLYFRLNVIPITLPPLRNREDDVSALIEHFSTVQYQRTGRPQLRWSDDALAVMQSYSWPGNVRELANIVERIAILNTGSLVRESDVYAVLPHDAVSLSPVLSHDPDTGAGLSQHDLGVGLTDLLDIAERQLITEALTRADGNVAEAARQLRTDRPNLYRRMKRLGITGAVVAFVLAGASVFCSAPLLHAQQSVSAKGDSSGVKGDSTGDSTKADSVSRDSTRDTTSVSYQFPSNDSPSRHLHFSLSSGKAYNRVEGLPIMLGPTFTEESNPLSLDAGVSGIVRTAPGIRLKEPDAGYDTHLTARFGPDHIFGLGVQAYDVVTPVESWQMTEPEAGLAAFLLHRDYMDYYGRHGGKVTGSWIINDKANVTLGYADERWSSVPLNNPFSLFRNSSLWRDNPQMDEGRFHIFTVGAVLDTRNDDLNPAGGWYLTGSYELGWSPSVLLAPRIQADEALDATPTVATDQYYGRIFLDIRRYNRISPRTQLDGRIVFGGWVQGDELPLERKFSVSGPGTLPGYDFREPMDADVQVCTLPGQWSSTPPAMCDRIVLGQLEFRTDLTGEPLGHSNAGGFHLPGVPLTQRVEGVIFTDIGRGWRMTQPLPSGYKADVGSGIDLGLLGVYVAKAVTDWSEPVHILVRVRRRF